jgi:LPXTG-motif cell wall-anchored protein
MKYKNALGDLFYSDKKHKEEMAKLELLQSVANKTSKTSNLIYVIPIAGIIVAGIIIFIAKKKKNK